MKEYLSKTPYVKLLIPAIIAIIVSTYYTIGLFSIVIACIGFAVTILSFYIPNQHKYRFRWVSGVGIFISIFGIFSLSTSIRSKQAAYDFDDEASYYIATVKGFPQEKTKSIALDLDIKHPKRKKIVSYLQKEEMALLLSPGDEIIFHSKINPFENFGNPDDFDYKRYMQNKGFAGSSYIPTEAWSKTNRQNKKSITNYAQILRRKALALYHSFNLSHDANAFISALTLGHKDDLSGNLKEAFQASGTSHILAVSGLHVGIIYTVLSLMFSLFSKTFKRLKISQFLIIGSLWLYAIIAGLSPSILRATIMLSIVSVGTIFRKQTYLVNILAATAFFILAHNPLQLFDVGFQMSFAAVAAIFYINPLINGILRVEHKGLKYLWSLLTVSISAQLGVLPITLYYFGTFPTYFFISNLIIIPFIGVIIYLCFALLLISAIQSLDLFSVSIIYKPARLALEATTELVLKTVYWIESLPMSQIDNQHLTLFQTIISITTIVFAIAFIKTKSPKIIISTLASTLILLFTFINQHLKQSPTHIAIFNTPNRTDIALYVDNKREHLDFKENGFIPHDSIRILLLSENRLSKIRTNSVLEVDILILAKDKSFSITKLNEIFKYNKLILDSTIPEYIKMKWIEECKGTDVEVYDVSKKGAYLIKM